MTIADKQFPLPYYSSILFLLIDGSLNLTMGRGNEIEMRQTVVRVLST